MTVRLVCAALFGFLLSLVPSAPVYANWLTHILKETGEAGSKAGKAGLGALDGAAGFVAKLPATGKGVPLAAHVTPEGHWTFVNRSGETFTAATPDEMASVSKVLAPDTGANHDLIVYLSEDAVFRERAHLKALPADAKLHVVAGDNAYGLTLRPSATGDGVFAEIRPNLIVEVVDRRMFEEAVFHLGRPLNRSNMRVVALEPGASRSLSSTPNYDPATKMALVDAVDPSALMTGLSRLKGQTVLVVGRVEGTTLHYTSATGAAGQLNITDIARAAESADANLVILQSVAGSQPGGRNWLWQKVEIAGLEDALNRATFGDFLNAIGAGRGELMVTVQPSTPGRIMLTALPSGQSAAPLTDQVGGWFSEVANHALGNVVLEGVQAFGRDQEREEEFERRLVPGIPSWVQFAYLAGLILGLLSLTESSPWWARIWPPESATEYASETGYRLARLVRGMCWFGIFLPIAGIPAFTWGFLQNLWYQIKAPVRWARWLRGKLTAKV